jgi:hypothetical protein
MKQTPVQGELFAAPAKPKRQRKPLPEWKRKATTHTTRLRELLKDGRWHNQWELLQAGGFRYGARLLEIRRGEDGGPMWEVKAERMEDSTAYRYQASGEGVAKWPG